MWALGLPYFYGLLFTKRREFKNYSNVNRIPFDEKSISPDVVYTKTDEFYKPKTYLRIHNIYIFRNSH